MRTHKTGFGCDLECHQFLSGALGQREKYKLASLNKRAMMALNHSPESHKMNSTYSITIVPTYDPRDGVSFDPRGII